MGPAFSFGVDRGQFFGTLTEMTIDDAKVSGAAFFGSFLPATNLFLGDAEVVFRVLALMGQVCVAGITCFYIWTKIRALKRK